jgi:HEAT repeat protein
LRRQFDIFDAFSMGDAMSDLLREREGLRHKDQISELIEALCGQDASKRERTRRALVAKGKAAVRPLVMLLSDRRPHVRWEASKALGKIGDPTVANALVEALEDEDSDVRWLAAVGLVGMKHKGLKPLLWALMERPYSIWLREGAHHVCHELVKKEFYYQLLPLLKALEQPNPEVSLPLAAYNAKRAICSFS